MDCTKRRRTNPQRGASFRDVRALVFDCNAYRGRIKAPRRRGSKGTPLARFPPFVLCRGAKNERKKYFTDFYCMDIFMPILFVPILYMPISFVRTKEIGERKTAGGAPDPVTERIFKMRSGYIAIESETRRHPLWTRGAAEGKQTECLD